MSNFFEKVKNNASEVQDELLGPTYPYYKNINMPNQIGMSSKGSIKALSKDIDGLIDYVELLVTGQGNASKTGKPLGNKFFLKTGGKCQPSGTSGSSSEVDRYIYIDNVPDGNIPFISGAMGMNFSQFEGLIPGAIGDLGVLNPFQIMQAFMIGETPPCQELTMETIDNKNNVSSETHYVAKVDIQNMDPCTFQNKKNPVSNKSCKEVFSTMFNNSIEKDSSFPKGKFNRFYLFTICLLFVFIFYRISKKR